MLTVPGLPLAEQSESQLDGDIFQLTTPESSDRYPAIVIDQGGQIVVAWESYQEGNGECIYTRLFDGETWSDKIKLSGSGLAYRPVAALDSLGKVHIAWAEFEDGSWNVYWAVMTNRIWSSPTLITTTGADYFPSIDCDSRGKTWIVWSSYRNGVYDIFGRVFDGDAWGHEFRITNHGASYRPNVVCDEHDKAWIGYDRFDLDLRQYNTYVLSVNGNSHETSHPMLLSRDSQIWNSDVSLALDGKGRLWAAWQGIGTRGYTADYVSFLDGAKWSQPQRIAPRQTLFSHCRIDRDSKGDIWLTSTLSRRAIETRRLTPEGWSHGYKVSQSGLNKHPSVAICNDGLLFTWQRSPLNGKVESRNADIYLRWLDVTHPGHGQLSPGSTDVSEKKLSESDFAIEIQPYNRPEVSERMWTDGYQVYWGDPHGQTNVSDGLGYPDQFYNYLIHISRMDFGAITDHSEYPDQLSDADWAYIKQTTRFFHRPGEFVTIHGFEWSSNEWKTDYGHANIYYPDDDPPLFRSCDPESEHPYGLFAAVKPYGAIVIPHHVAANWGQVGASYDWNYFDKEVQPIVEICSNHGIFEYTGNPRAHRFESKNNHVQDALARGYQVGFIGGSDSHGMQPGDDGGIAAVLVRGELSRANIFDAWRNRRCYASTAPRMAIDFAVNGHIMGETLIAKGKQPIEITGCVKAPGNIKHIDLVKNNKDIATFQPRENATQSELCFKYTDTEEVGINVYYYLRVTLVDGETTWTSPIWVER